jgi:Flp pilus assembly protein TadB
VADLNDPSQPTPGPSGPPLAPGERRVTTSRKMELHRPERVRRDPADSARVWSARRRTFTFMAIGWAVLALVGGLTGLGTTFAVLAVLAALLCAAVVVKATVIVRRDGGWRPPG